MTLLEVLPQMKTGTGFFSSFVSPIWEDDFTNTAQLDIFFAYTYGERNIAPILNAFIGDDGTIEDDDLDVIASMIYQIRGEEWAKLYDVYKADYNVLDNTEFTESSTDTKTGSTTDGNTRTLNTSTANSGTGSVTSEGSGTGSVASNKYGFDSSAAVGDTTGSDSSNTESSTSSTTSNTVTDTGTVTDAGTGSYTETATHTYTKHGNIGVMTPDQLLTGSVNMWQWTFIIQIMNDICNLISLSVY